jgi:signal transduction histidine kinase
MTISTRVEIALEIHDGIAQDLVALGYQLDLVLAQPGTPPDIRNEIRTIRFSVTSIAEKVRAEIFALRDTPEFTASLTAALEVISPAFIISIAGAEFNEIHANALLRVIPELLRNAHNHSGASDISLTITQVQDHSVVVISDNGTGGAQVTPGRYGISGAIERIENIGGSISIDSNSLGTLITITL